MADYRKMWEELGMDVDLHDQLCAVLPQAFGACFSVQINILGYRLLLLWYREAG